MKTSAAEQIPSLPPFATNLGVASLLAIFICYFIFVLSNERKRKMYATLKFMYHCFIKPFLPKSKHVKTQAKEGRPGEDRGEGSSAHQNRLEDFYEGQVDVYDTTRERLLRGRNSMLRLCAGQLIRHHSFPAVTPVTASVLGRSLKRNLSSCSLFSQPSLPTSPSSSSQEPSTNNRKLVWVDVGGGTGSNIEKMNEYFPISNFYRVYCVDITPSMCDVARSRFKQLGWDNVHVVCCNAEDFSLPSVAATDDGDTSEESGMELALVTFSYSLSMMESIYEVVDRFQAMLSLDGIIGVADFYVSGRQFSKDPTRQTHWFQRWFWAIWFDLDGICLHSSRREYLEHKFLTVKMSSNLNPFLRPIAYIPYYVWVGGQKASSSRSPSSFASGAKQAAAACGKCQPSSSSSPLLSSTQNAKALELTLKDLSKALPTSPTASESSGGSGEHNELDFNSPLSSPGGSAYSSSSSSTFSRQQEREEKREKHRRKKELSASLVVSRTHVHGHGVQWREPFRPALLNEFSTYIYAFAWEDPREDLKVLNLSPDDRMLVMTSGGCNVLEYALHSPARIHSVDMNPAQGHMLELKLAGLSAFDYNSFWQLFGEGFVQGFEERLENELAAYLSPYAYQFWHQNSSFSNLYSTGCSGLAIRIFRIASKIQRVGTAIEEMCHADDLKSQWQIYTEQVRPRLLSPFIVKLLNNDKFLWGALGVPQNQMQMLLDEGTAYDYVINTIDPVVKNHLFKTDSYFYYLGLMKKYLPTSCPTYLTPQAFGKLSSPGALDCIRIHTDSILKILQTQIEDGELTKAVVMDHLDWFSEKDARDEISMLAKKMKSSGRVLWRSAAKYPWYNTIFRECGFDVHPVQIRENGMCIDRVNMYASFWYGVRQ